MVLYIEKRSGGLNRRNFVVHELLTIIPNEKRFGGLGNVRRVAELEPKFWA